MMKRNQYLIGDNIEILNELEDNYYQLSYLDPPFNTGRDFNDFNDKFKNNKEYAYDFIKPRLKLIYQKLTNDGTIIFHCDIKANYYIRIILDEVFGETNFKNEIIWITNGNKNTTKVLGRSHDNIFVYSKSNKQKFNMMYLPYDDDYKKRLKKDSRGKYTTSSAHNSQPNVIQRPNLRYEWNGNYKQWWISKERMEKLHNEDRLEYNKKGIPRIKRYFHEMNGVPLRDTWSDISSIQGNEKLDYATQKPVKLLERIISLYTDKNDNVLDCFAGSGTIGRACININRNYTLIDINEKGKNIFKDSI